MDGRVARPIIENMSTGGPQGLDILMQIWYIFLDELFISLVDMANLERFVHLSRGSCSQYDEPDLNKSWKSRPKTPTVLKVIP